MNKKFPQFIAILVLISILLLPISEVHADTDQGIVSWLFDRIVRGTLSVATGALDSEGNLVGKTLSGLTWYFVTVPATIFAGFAGIFFDWMAAISLGTPLGSGPNADSIYNISSDRTGAGGFVYLGWSILRDITNIIFIFIVLYIGISTILGILSGDLKKLLIRIVLAAIFINFSLVLTGLVIDASNAAALGFYNAFPESNDLVTKLGIAPPGSKSLTAPIAKTPGFTDLFNTETFVAGNTTTVSPATSGGSDGKGAMFNIVRAIMVGMGGLIMITAGFLFLTRTIILIFVMILSPLAIAAYAIPNFGEKYFKEWLNHLLHHAFWAPAFMIMYYVAVRLITSTFFSTYGASPGGGIIQRLVIYSVNLGLALGFLWGSIVISRKLAGYGRASIINSKILKTSDRTIGRIGQNTIGRAASTISNSDAAKRFAARNPRIGAMMLRPIDYTASATFGGAKGGYNKALENKVERQAKLYDKVGKDKEGNDLKLYSGGLLSRAYSKAIGLEPDRDAQNEFVRSLGKQRSKRTALSGFKRGEGKKVNVVEERYTKEDEKKGLGKAGEIKKAYTTTVGGKQTRADRETLLKIKKKSGKSNLDKLKDEIEKDAKEKATKEAGESKPETEKSPESGGGESS